MAFDGSVANQYCTLMMLTLTSGGFFAVGQARSALPASCSWIRKICASPSFVSTPTVSMAMRAFGWSEDQAWYSEAEFYNETAANH